MNKRTTAIKIIEDVMENFLNTYNYGDVIETEEFETMLGAKKEDSKYVVLLRCLKDELVRYGYILSPVIGVGYKILFPNEVPAEVFKKYGINAVKRLNKGLFILKSIDTNLLSDREKEGATILEEGLARIRNQAEAELISMQSVLFERKIKELN